MRENLFLGLLFLSAVFIPLERLFPLRREQKTLRAGWRTDLIHFFANGFVTNAALAVVVFGVALLLRGFVSADLHTLVRSQPGWLQFIEAVLIADFSFYVAHRLAHTLPWLWRFHAVHHSSEQMDWLAAARVHPLDQVWNRAVIFVPLFLLGFTKEVFGAYLVITQVQAIFLHANVRFRFGPLRWLFATPEFHHWHHSSDAEAINKNFAGQLPLWDWLFGTLHLPRGQRPQRYGIGDTDQPVPAGYLQQMAFPFGRQKAEGKRQNSEFRTQNAEETGSWRLEAGDWKLSASQNSTPQKALPSSAKAMPSSKKFSFASFRT